jgi:transposase-like protein
MSHIGRVQMKKTRRRYDREFKISVIAELMGDKPLAQISREHSIHPSLPSRWKKELADNPENAFRGNGNQYKENARIREQEGTSAKPDNGGLRRNGKKNTGQIFKIIQDVLSEDSQLSIRKACLIHGVSRSGYYKWMKRPEPTPSAIGLDNDVKDQVQKIVSKFPEYGYRRVTIELRDRGYMVNHKRVLRIMRSLKNIG